MPLCICVCISYITDVFMRVLLSVHLRPSTGMTAQPTHRATSIYPYKYNSHKITASARKPNPSAPRRVDTRLRV